MITTAIVDDSLIDDGLRIIKIDQFGAKTANESLPFGVDSSPIRNMCAIYAETSEDGEPVIVGYINEDQLAEAGETRLFSTDKNGILKTYIWLKNTGKIEIGGNTKNLVTFQDLTIALNDFAARLATEMSKVASGIATGGGVYVPGDLSIDISDSKTEDLLVK